MIVAVYGPLDASKVAELKSQLSYAVWVGNWATVCPDVKLKVTVSPTCALVIAG